MMLLNTIAIIAAALLPLSAATTNCKCTPGDDCWPTEIDWQQLNTTINGHLIKAKPAASVCYKSEPNYSEAACSEIRLQWGNSSYHAQDPISIDYPFMADDPCPPIFPNGTSIGGNPNSGRHGCTLGRYPSFVVNATSAEMIAEALRWASKKRVRVVIKGTGHSHLGSIWTHNLKNIEYHPDFKSGLCSTNATVTNKAVTIGAGEVGIDVNRALAKHGAVAVTGSNPADQITQSVGVVGWFTGGGHGPLSSTYGMGSDNLLEATLVTPNGTILTVNTCQHGDLFYALRGGGGGTYGVVTSVVMKAYASPRTSLWTFSATLLNNTMDSNWWDLVTFFHQHLVDWKASGLQGYYYILGPPLMPTRMLTLGFYLYDKPDGTLEKLIEPWNDQLNGMEKVISWQSEVKTAASFMEIYKDSQNEPVAQGGGFSLGSRLLPAQSLLDRDALRQMLQEVSGVSRDNTTSIPTPAIIGHVIANAKNANMDTGLNPAWRKAVVHFLMVGGWPDDDSKAVAQIVRDDVTFRKTYAMRKLAPDSGAYFNEMDINEPNWQYAAFGDNYPRLLHVKNKYDPESLLWCKHCVGSEKWVENENGKLCRPLWQ
ncbi:hypothetical protein NLG97_g128 [Lecanicillium saksenae]|uniref:Uncharacterized protein n=1 Tax=Lecanicillium saksenae TaxID=468837 RepID=A0ACC1R7L2_9HYPO|nr:hypothetical protein NLG97_g128 [Lecanicillium saksenae]